MTVIFKCGPSWNEWARAAGGRSEPRVCAGFHSLFRVHPRLVGAVGDKFLTLARLPCRRWGQTTDGIRPGGLYDAVACGCGNAGGASGLLGCRFREWAGWLRSSHTASSRTNPSGFACRAALRRRGMGAAWAAVVGRGSVHRASGGEEGWLSAPSGRCHHSAPPEGCPAGRRTLHSIARQAGWKK